MRGVRATARGLEDEPGIRAAREDEIEAVAALLLESSPELYEIYAGSRERALRLLVSALKRPDTTASLEVVTVAEAGGRLAAAMAAFPVDQGSRRGSALLRLSLRVIPPWHWRGLMRVYRHGSRHVPPPPQRSYYIDSIATFNHMRRRGAGTALLRWAEERARAHGLDLLALETEIGNTGARALYERFGFEEAARGEPAGGLPGFVAYVKRL
jgi:ribosomal protein S18 acetylase RimI-like enzyme